MSDRAQLETDIVSTAKRLANFRVADPALLRTPLIAQFMDMANDLHSYYKDTDDTVVHDEVLGAIIDCTILLGAISDNNRLPNEDRATADKLCATMEAIVNAITHEVEQNIKSTR